MILVALVFSACQLIVFSCFAIAAHVWFQNEKRKAIEQASALARSLIEAPDNNTPSALAVVMDQAAMLLAARLAQQLKAMLAGVESGESKAEQLAMFESASAGNPLVGILGAILPKRIRNKLLANPQMLGALGRIGGGGGGNHDAGTITRKHRD